MMFNTTRTPVTVFKSTDPGAPVLASAEGALKTVLKACLVTGYGTKTALGWEALSESDFEITFRSRHVKATKCCLVINNKTKQRVAQVRAFLTHADAVSNNNGNTSSTYNFAYNRSGMIQKWWLIGNDRAFVFLVNTSNSAGTRFIYFGDFASASPADNFNNIFLCSYDGNVGTSDNMSTGSSSPLYGSSGAYYSYFSKSYDGLVAWPSAGTNAIGKELARPARGIYPNVISGGLAASEIYLLEQTGSGGGIRGILGGIFFGFDRMGGIPDGTELYNVDSSDDVWIKFEMDDSSSPQHDFSCLINATAWDM